MPMSSKVTYTPEPERRLEGKWQSCSPHEAQRWAVYRKTWLPKRHGMTRPKPKVRLLATFFGPDAEQCARQLVAHSISLGKRKPKPRPNVRYMSLTKEQWLAAQERSR